MKHRKFEVIIKGKIRKKPVKKARRQRRAEEPGETPAAPLTNDDLLETLRILQEAGVIPSSAPAAPIMPTFPSPIIPPFRDLQRFPSPNYPTIDYPLPGQWAGDNVGTSIIWTYDSTGVEIDVNRMTGGDSSMIRLGGTPNGISSDPQVNSIGMSSSLCITGSCQENGMSRLEPIGSGWAGIDYGKRQEDQSDLIMIRNGEPVWDSRAGLIS